METKDWIILIVPIIANGIIIFILEKIFERKRIIKNTKYEYVSVMRRKIDTALSLHAKAAKLAIVNANEFNIDNAVLQYLDSCLDVYYYYGQNKIIFKTLDNHMNNLAVLIDEYSNCAKEPNNGLKCSEKINEIKDVLMLAKNECIKY